MYLASKLHRASIPGWSFWEFQCHKYRCMKDSRRRHKIHFLRTGSALDRVFQNSLDWKSERDVPPCGLWKYASTVVFSEISHLFHGRLSLSFFCTGRFRESTGRVAKVRIRKAKQVKAKTSCRVESISWRAWLCAGPATRLREFPASRTAQSGSWVRRSSRSRSTPIQIGRRERLAGTLPGTDAEMITLLTRGVWKTGKPLRPPMPRFQMTRTDAEAVVAYLKSVKPAGPATVPSYRQLLPSGQATE
jgi:hypothetical protein